MCFNNVHCTNIVIFTAGYSSFCTQRIGLPTAPYIDVNRWLAAGHRLALLAMVAARERHYRVAVGKSPSGVLQWRSWSALKTAALLKSSACCWLLPILRLAENEMHVRPMRVLDNRPNALRRDNRRVVSTVSCLACRRCLTTLTGG